MYVDGMSSLYTVDVYDHVYVLMVYSIYIYIFMVYSIYIYVYDTDSSYTILAATDPYELSVSYMYIEY